MTVGSAADEFFAFVDFVEAEHGLDGSYVGRFISSYATTHSLLINYSVIILSIANVE